MYKNLLILIIPLILVVNCLPVTKNKNLADDDDSHKKDENDNKNLEEALEYERYLKEVVQVLETDPDFRKKLDKAHESDIRSGKIATELEYVNHNVRSKLDELKRKELQRLREYASKTFELTNEIDRDHLKIPEHLDHRNPHTFEIEDLKKLILKTTKDLAEADKKRREEFKQYELQKEFEKQESLKTLDEEGKKKLQHELDEKKEKHNNHEKVHHPGNKAQLEEVWEKQDHMDGVDFEPKSFFAIHDLDSNGVWDQEELKALFSKELDKVYQLGLPEDDMRERAEEMERMREHVFGEMDVNKDGLISFQEFIDQTKREEFQRDPEWETVDNSPQFTHEEYLEFERRRQDELMRQGYQPNLDSQYHPNNIPHGEMNQQQPIHQQPSYQAPNQHNPNQIPNQPPQFNQNPQQSQYQNQIPPQSQYQNQIPPQSQPQNQNPQHQNPQHQNPQHQNPPPQYQNQLPPQYQNQVPQYQNQPQYPNQQYPNQQQLQPPLQGVQSQQLPSQQNSQQQNAPNQVPQPQQSVVQNKQ